MCKTRDNISSHIMNELFEERNILYDNTLYTLSKTDLTRGTANTVNNGLKSLKCLGSKIWDIIPSGIRNYGKIEEFTRSCRIVPLKNCTFEELYLLVEIVSFSRGHSLWKSLLLIEAVSFIRSRPFYWKLFLSMKAIHFSGNRSF